MFFYFNFTLKANIRRLYRHTPIVWCSSLKMRANAEVLHQKKSLKNHHAFEFGLLERGVGEKIKQKNGKEVVVIFSKK